MMAFLHGLCAFLPCAVPENVHVCLYPTNNSAELELRIALKTFESFSTSPLPSCERELNSGNFKAIYIEVYSEVVIMILIL
jgi:hypothetical protein